MIPGQDTLVDSALFSEPLPDGWNLEKWFGGCHDLCLVHSNAGDGWAELLRRRELLHFACEEVACEQGARLFVNSNGGYVRIVGDGGGSTILSVGQLKTFLVDECVFSFSESKLAQKGRDANFLRIAGFFASVQSVPILAVVDGLSISDRLSSRAVLEDGVFDVPEDYAEFLMQGECWVYTRCQLYVPPLHSRILLREGANLLDLLSRGMRDPG